ncbi:ABC transporter ATP-binding protein/permease [Geminocystis sp. CENA526]|uniref:ABC transporter ATP-binding protein/permease n=1 Tax=Geminocystis sp. CENA526 TaxID=1355871 RepID=UPI003D6FD32E
MKLIEVTNISKKFTYKGETKQIINDISFIVETGEFVVLKGNNGSGKTTLINLILGISKPDKGEIKLLNYSPQSPESKLNLGVVLQKVALPKNVTVQELVNLLRSYYPNSPSTQEILNRVNLQEKSNFLASKLSGGEEQRLFFAIALAGNPQLLILDEPTRNLDQDGLNEFWQQIKACREQGISILMVTNNNSDWEVLNDFVTRTITISDGKIQENYHGNNQVIDNINLTNKKDALTFNYFVKMWQEQIWFEVKQYLANYEIIIGILLFSLIPLFLPQNLLPLPSIYQPNKIILAILALLFMLVFSLICFGKIVAFDRVEGWLKLLRFTPLPPMIYLGSKVIVFLGLLMLSLVTMFSLSAWKLHIQQTPLEWIFLIFVLIFGCIPLTILGLSFAYILRPKAIDIVAMLLLIPALLTVGLPLPFSPIIQDLVIFSPFYHYGQLISWGFNLPNYDHYFFIHISWLIWFSICFYLLANYAYKQEKTLL